jgi:hypothetical protein
VEWLFRRHFWIVQLAFLALAAIILASALTKYIEYRLVTEFALPEKKARMVLAKSAHRDFNVANERNLFKTKREIPEKTPLGGNCNEYWDADETSLRVRLVGTAVFNNPGDSLALIEDQKQPTAGAKAYSISECGNNFSRSFGSGDAEPSEPAQACNQVPGVGKIKRIDAECVYFYNDSSRRCEFMRLNNSDACNPDASSIHRALPLPEAPVTQSEEPGKSVKRLGPTSFELDRSDLDNLLNNLGQILTTARVLPDTVDGKPALKFVSIQPNAFKLAM